MKKNLLLLFVHVFLFTFSQNRSIDSLLDEGFNKGQYESSELFINTIQKKILDNKDATEKQKARAHHLMNGVYSVMGDYQKAINSSLEAKKIADKIGAKEYSVMALGSLGENYRRIGLYGKAKDVYYEALEILGNEDINKSETKYFAPVIAYELGNVYYKEKDYRRALTYYKEAVLKAKKISIENKNDESSINGILSTNYLLIGHCYVDTKKLDSAEVFYNKVRDIVYQKNDKYRQVYLLKSYGDLFFAKEDYKKASDSAEKAQKLLFFKNEEFSSNLYELLAKINLKLKNNKESEEYFELAEKNNEKKDKEKQNAISSVIYSSEKQYKEQVNYQKNWKQFLLISLLILGVIAVYFISLYRKKSKQDKELYTKIINKLKVENFQNDIPLTAPIESQKGINEEKEAELLNKLSKFERAEKFVNSKLSLSLLASQLNTNTNYISEIINKHKGKNYNTYINELRIDFICKKIVNEPEYRNYKISYLAEASGFSTYASFSSVFKNITGMSPSTFINQANQENKKLVKDN